MQTIKLLLGNWEGLLNNFIEMLVQDACKARGPIESIRTVTIDEFTHEGLTGRYDLAILIPNNLAPEWMVPTAFDAFGEGSKAIRRVRARCATPIVAISAFDRQDEEERLLLEAGAACVLELPFN